MRLGKALISLIFVVGLLPAAALAHANPLHEYSGPDLQKHSRGSSRTLVWSAEARRFVVPQHRGGEHARRLSGTADAPSAMLVRSIGGYEAKTVDVFGTLYADYASSVDTSRTALFRSSDEGATFQLAYTFPSPILPVAALPDGTLFGNVRVNFLDSQDNTWKAHDTLMRSDDHGATWNQVCFIALGSSLCDSWLPVWPGDAPGQAWYESQLLTQDSIASCGGYTYLATYNSSHSLFGNTNITYRSADDGRTFQAVHVDTAFRHVHGLVETPGCRLIELIGDDSVADGIWYSDDHGETLHPLVSNRTVDRHNILVEASLNNQGHLNADTDIGSGDNALIDVDPVTGVLKDLATVPYESFCSRPLPGNSAVVVGTVYEATGLKDGDPNLHLYVIYHGAAYQIYSTPIPNVSTMGYLCPVGVFPNGDVAVYQSDFGTLIIHITLALTPHLQVTAPTAVSTGAPFALTVRALDASNNVVTTYTGTAHFTSNDGAAVLPADYTFTAADAGSHTFSATLARAGPQQSVTATDVAQPAVTGTALLAVQAPDLVPPTIQVTAPADGARYARGAGIVAAYACADAGGSGVAGCAGSVGSGSAIDTSTLGPKSFTVDATDNAGNRSSALVHYTVVDPAGPTVTLNTPADGAFYRQGSRVLASYACHDGSGGSAIASCLAPVAVDAPIETATEGAHAFTVVATDNGGNSASRTATYEVDGSAPRVTVTAPGEGLTYAQGSVQPAAFACDDGVGSGVASCTATVANGNAFDTAIAGAHTFVVHSADRAGNLSAATVHYMVVDRTVPTSTVPPSTGGAGGGGGGGGGVPPDLHVELTADAAVAPAVGSQLVYSARVSVRNAGSASAVRLDLLLPVGFTVTRSYTDRGAGCGSAASTMSCDVGWISPGTDTNVTIWGTVASPGEQEATATVTSLLEKEADPTDNSTTLRLVPAAPVVLAPPVLLRVGGTFTVHAAHVGAAAIIKTAFTADEALTLNVAAFADGSRSLTLLGGSRLGTSSSAEPRRRITLGLNAQGTVPVVLRVPYASLRRGSVYRLIVVGTSSEGQTGTLVVRFRR